MSENVFDFKGKKSEEAHQGVLRSNQKELNDIVSTKEMVKEIIEFEDPKSSCRHCLGSGFIGRDVDSGLKVKCKCVKRKPRVSQ